MEAVFSFQNFDDVFEIVEVVFDFVFDFGLGSRDKIASEFAFFVKVNLMSAFDEGVRRNVPAGRRR